MHTHTHTDIHAFLLARLPRTGSTSSFLPTPRVSDAVNAAVAKNNIDYANCYSVGGALAGGDARRRGGGGGATIYSRSCSRLPLNMMAGECVGGTDISRVLFVCLYNIMTRCGMVITCVGMLYFVCGGGIGTGGFAVFFFFVCVAVAWLGFDVVST